MDATEYRLNRLFSPEAGRFLTVAVDHGFSGRQDLLTGIQDMADVVDRLVEAGPDALLLTSGQAPLLQRHRGRHRPALVLRVDVTNVHGAGLDDDLFAGLVADPVARALRLDAACVVVNLYDVEGQEHMRRESIENITALKASGEPVGMPVMIEPFVYAPDRSTGTWTVVADTGRNLALMRQAAELGADVIKADPTDDPAGYARVVTAAGVPVVVRGGGRVSDAELFRRTEDVLSNGASGLVYGRNVIQHPRPRAIIDALRALVHDGVSAEDAVTRMRDR